MKRRDISIITGVAILAMQATLIIALAHHPPLGFEAKP